MDADDKRREAERAFDDALRAKIAASRPSLEDLMGRSGDREQDKPTEETEQEKSA